VTGKKINQDMRFSGMKIKYAFIAVTAILLAISISQTLPIPPHADDMRKVYKSGYFRELERECSIIRDSFLGIKALADPSFAWVYLEDMVTAHNILVKVYDRRGHVVPAPGMTGESPDAAVSNMLARAKPEMESSVRNGRYFTLLPVKAEGKCSFCHEDVRPGGVVGYMSFEQSYDAHVYYSRERILIFLGISMALMIILFLFIRWEIGRAHV
jgi:hypothetical protein